MKPTLRALALSALALLAGIAQAAPVNLIVNGGFEATAVADNSWVNVSSIAGWTLAAGPGTGFEIRNNVEGAAKEGKNFIELDTNGNTAITQTLAGLSAGSLYELSFWYSPRVNQGAATNGINAFWNDQQLGATLSGDGGTVNAWTEQRFSVAAQGGSNVLRFAAVGLSDGLGGNLDNVRLNGPALNVSAVPEPASLALVGLGLAVAAAVRRRKAG